MYARGEHSGTFFRKSLILYRIFNGYHGTNFCTNESLVAAAVRVTYNYNTRLEG